MNMSTTFNLLDEVTVRPTPGLDAARGVVQIIGIGVLAVLPSSVDVQAYLIDDEAYDSEIKAGAWYAFHYLDASIDQDYGVSWLPESLFLELVAES